MVICLERDADLHMAQLMPLPLTVSCSSKIQIGFTFLVPANPGSPGKRAVKRVCVCVCVCTRAKYKSIQNCKLQNQTCTILTTITKLWLYIYDRYELNEQSVTSLQRI